MNEIRNIDKLVWNYKTPTCVNVQFIFLNRRLPDDIFFVMTNVLLHILRPLLKLWMVYLWLHVYFFPSSILISRVSLTGQFLHTNAVGNNFLSLKGLPLTSCVLHFHLSISGVTMVGRALSCLLHHRWPQCSVMQTQGVEESFSNTLLSLLHKQACIILGILI